MTVLSVLKRREQNVVGDRALTQGTFGIAQSGAEIDTGLEICEHLQLQGTAANAAGTARYEVSTDFPRSGTAVPYTADGGGYWMAYGR